MKKIISFILVLLTLVLPVCAEPIVDETAHLSSHFENASGQTISNAKVGDTVYFTVNLSGIGETKCGHIGVIKLDFSYPSDILALTNSKEDKRYIDESSYTAPGIPENYRDTIYATNPEKGKMVFYYNYNITKIKQSAITKDGVVFRVAFKVLKAGNCKVSYLKNTCSAAGWNKKENRVAGFYLTYSSAPSLKIEANKTQVVSQSHSAPINLTLKRKGKRKVAVSWALCNCRRKYTVKYAYNKKMKKAKFKSTYKNKLVLKKLKSGKRLYVRVKAKGSGYSKRKSIKIY